MWYMIFVVTWSLSYYIQFSLMDNKIKEHMIYSQLILKENDKSSFLIIKS